MVHIKLNTIKGQLQARMHYPLKHLFEDDEYMTLDEAFDALLYGFMKHKYKTIELSGAMKLVTLRRGWMTEKLADEFTDYCITGWKIV